MNFIRVSFLSVAKDLQLIGARFVEDRENEIFR